MNNKEKDIEYYNNKLIEKNRTERFIEKPSHYSAKTKYKCILCNAIHIGSFSQLIERTTNNCPTCKKININKQLEENASNYRLVGEFTAMRKFGEFSCPNHEETFSAIIGNVVNGITKCGVCSGSKLNSKNSLIVLYPHLVELFVDKKIAETLTYSSNKRVELQCPNCKTIKTNTVQDLVRFGFSCSQCRDGVSFGEKFIKNMLVALGYTYDREYSPVFVRPKRYDFYVPGLNLIIEIHGKQHYEDNCFYEALSTVQENDILKRQLALSNGIEHYIELNFSSTELNKLNIEIINKLKNIIPSIIQLDFHQIHLQSQEPITKQCWDLYNKGYKQIDIQKELKISHASVQRYLAKGKELGVIDYQTTAKKHEQRFQLFLKLWDEGVRKNQVLADKIGVSVSTILDYKHKANIL